MSNPSLTEEEVVGNETDSLAKKQAKREKRLKDLSKRDDVNRRLVLQTLMNEVAGRRYIWTELQKAHVFESVYVAGSFDETAYREGKRIAGNQLLLDITRWCPANYIQMTKENASVEIEEGEDDE